MGSELYNELKKEFPETWGKLPSELEVTSTNNFENGLYILVKSALSGIVPNLIREMATYFLKFQFTNSKNLYSKLLKDINAVPNEIIFGTLNYDLLFEQALEENNLFPSYFEDSIDKMLILKLHGSCNFLPPNNISITECSFIGYIKFIDYPIHAATREETMRFCNSDTSVSPTMCLYTKGKIAQFGHGQIDKIWKLWKEHVENAERILIIGARWNSEDSHIWDPLSKTSAELAFIGSKNSFDEWTSSSREKIDSKFLGCKWKDSFELGINFIK